MSVHRSCDPRYDAEDSLDLKRDVLSVKECWAAFEGQSTAVHDLLKNEKQIVAAIKRKTKERNRNNVTRTQAYLQYYHHHPEIHWSLLAHMVSRNGGWNMTDLKGDLLPHLLSEAETQDFFHLLERCNWLIFEDAYPQLLLYEESKRMNAPLFHLLPQFHVSRFMQVLWSWFWNQQRSKGDSSRLSKGITYALILNEQHHIEERVIQHPLYERQVLEQWPFIIQSILHFNHVLFPYHSDDPDQVDDPDVQADDPDVQVAGTTVANFSDVFERIRVGKRLYSILFLNQHVSHGIQKWTMNRSHTGSRQDYWPALFTSERNVNRDGGNDRLDFQLQRDHLHRQADSLYSPALEDVWPTVSHKPCERAEWCRNESVFEKWAEEWAKEEKNIPFEMTDKHLFALNKIEAVSIVNEKLFRK